MYDSISIVIPVYNEKENILKTISEIKMKIKTSHQIFVIYDFEDDNTIPVVRSLMERDKSVRLVKNKYGRGACNAIKTGFANADSGVILVVMADLSDDLSKGDEMFAKINGGYDIVCGSRYVKAGGQIGGPLFKKFLSRAAGISLHYLVGLPTHDVTNSFKMYTKRVLNDIQIESEGGFELGMEILIKAFIKGHRIAEIPSTWRDRKVGRSRFRLWTWLPRYTYWYCYALCNCLIK